MYWSDWIEFLAMGGYASYVWGAYSVVFAWVLLEPLYLHRAHRRALQSIAEDAE